MFEVLDYNEVTTKEVVIKATLQYKDGVCINRMETISFAELDEKITLAETEEETEIEE